jgi:LPXTG-motif cell wall-anchored protein
VHFSFTAPSDPGNQESLSYELHIDGPLGPGIVASPPETSGISVLGLTAGGHYCFVVSASNGAYQVNSAPSCITLAGTTSTPPSALASTGSSSGVLVILGAASLSFGAVVLRRRWVS